MMMTEWMKLPSVEAGVEEVDLVTAVYSERRRDDPGGPFRRRSGGRCRSIELQESLLHSIDLRKALLVYGSDASVGVTHTSDEEWEEGQQGDVFHGEEDQSLSGGGEVHGDGCGQEEDEGGVELLWQGFKLVHAG
ncbi:hypothetical protein LR48_Vigan03g111100 [Vigna angularis]|uniref:Uncharacterized protein n=1 Tax=Phaseolus angularis TaxID=3914 RepID=A0A0L9U5M5_PHAAN|nr:hypothetical protein LR48_Vigan03g111100 [Vigna angularis]